MAEPSVVPTNSDEIVALERLGRLGWPPLESCDIDGWNVGTSGAYTRRANSVAPERSGRRDLAARIDHVEAYYRERGRPAIFKLTSAAKPAELDDVLAARGYTTDGDTLGMTLDVEACLALPGATGAPAADVIAGRVDEAWFAASTRLSSVAPAKRGDYRAILERCLETCDAALFGRVVTGAEIDAVALACVTGETVSFVSVATDPVRRGKRYAESVMRSLLYVAAERGAERGLLNVEASNASARALYARLGFVERYRYWYREAPAP